MMFGNRRLLIKRIAVARQCVGLAMLWLYGGERDD